MANCYQFKELLAQKAGHLSPLARLRKIHAKNWKENQRPSRIPEKKVFCPSGGYKIKDNAKIVLPSFIKPTSKQTTNITWWRKISQLFMCIMILSHLTRSNKYPLMSDANKERKIVTEKKSDGRSSRIWLPPHPTKNKNLGKVTKRSPSYIRTACYVCGALQSLHFLTAWADVAFRAGAHCLPRWHTAARRT